MLLRVGVLLLRRRIVTRLLLQRRIAVRLLGLRLLERRLRWRAVVWLLHLGRRRNALLRRRCGAALLLQRRLKRACLRGRGRCWTV